MPKSTSILNLNIFLNIIDNALVLNIGYLSFSKSGGQNERYKK